MNLQNLSYLGFLAPFALFWQQGRDFFKNIIAFFWRKNTIPYAVQNDIYKFLNNNSLRIPLGNYNINNTHVFFKDGGCSIPIFYKEYNKELFLYKYFIPIFISGENRGLNISYLSFITPFISILNKAIEKYEISIQNKNIFTNFCYNHIQGSLSKGNALKNGYSNSQPEATPLTMAYTTPTADIYNIKYCELQTNIINNIKLNEISINPLKNNLNKYQFTKQGTEILEKCKKWYAQKYWYECRNINWRRGFLLHGKPGTGKSALILEIARSLELPIYQYDLSTFDNVEFCAKLEAYKSEVGILLFEDFDAIFDKRKNLTATANFNGLTFDSFLNALSGVNSVKNKLIFITTNHLDKIDEALLRPGRIDEIIEIESINLEEKAKMAKVFVEDNKIVNQLLIDGANDTTAEFENRCTQIALNNLWK